MTVSRFSLSENRREKIIAPYFYGASTPWSGYICKILHGKGYTHVPTLGSTAYRGSAGGKGGNGTQVGIEYILPATTTHTFHANRHHEC